MAEVGMDADVVRGLASKLDVEAGRIATVVGDVDRLLADINAEWLGRDADQFVGWWRQQHRVALLGLHDAVAGLAGSVRNNASAQDTASSSSGGAAVGVAAGAVAAGGAAAGGAATVAGGAATAPSPTPPTQSGGMSGPQGSQSFAASKAADIARSEVGSKRPTGWNQEGECVKSVQRWVNNAGGKFVGGGVVSSYQHSGATPIGLGQAGPGDVIQYTSTTSPDSWANGVHTVMIVGRNSDGTFDIVQSNAALTGKVTEVTRWMPSPPKGFEARVWRFGQH